ncbi:hypothetical protein AAH994_13655 [Weeksellaceae bacterium A-14]
MSKSEIFKYLNRFINVCYFGVAVSAIFCFFSNPKDWSATEFFITYQNGFLKRGLVGSVLYIVNSILKIPAEQFVNGFVVVLIIINLSSICFLFIHKKLDAYILFTCSLLLNIYAWHIAFRLDLLLIPLMLLQLMILRSIRIRMSIKIYSTSFLLCLGILIHEVYFLISVYIFLYIFYFELKIKKTPTYLIAFSPPLVLFLLMITLFKGNAEQAHAILLSWEKLGIAREKLNYLKWLYSLNGPIFIWDNAAFIKNRFYFIGFFINYMLVCTSFYFYIKHFFKVTLKTKFLLYGNFILIIFLCFIATDFIRWYYLVFLLVLFYFIFFKKKKDSTLNAKYLILKSSTLFIGLPMYGWSPTHYYWTAPIKFLIDLKDYF